jgi:hypothetical protein
MHNWGVESLPLPPCWISWRRCRRAARSSCRTACRPPAGTPCHRSPSPPWDLTHTMDRSISFLLLLRACQGLGKVRPNFPGTFICFGSRIGPKTLVRTSVADLDPLFGLLDPDPLVRDKDPDPSIIIVRNTLIPTVFDFFINFHL